MHRPDEGGELKLIEFTAGWSTRCWLTQVQGGLVRSIAQAQVLFEHAVYGPGALSGGARWICIGYCTWCRRLPTTRASCSPHLARRSGLSGPHQLRRPQSMAGAAAIRSSETTAASPESARGGSRRSV